MPRKPDKNPALNRSRAHDAAIRRTLVRIAKRLDFFHSLTQGAVLPWLSYHHLVNARDDDRQDWARQLYLDEPREDDGYMPGFNQRVEETDTGGIISTNRIMVASYYGNSNHDGYFIVKPAMSPLPCDKHGCLPLRLAEWRIIAPALCVTRMFWQWVPSLREFAEDDSWQPAGVVGWHLVENRKTTNPLGVDYSEGETHWTGQLIITDLAAAYAQSFQKDSIRWEQ